MGYKETQPACYLVAWDEAHIMKAGYSHCQRWRPFVLRGARLVHVEFFPRHTFAFDLEIALDSYLRKSGPLAFISAKHAVPYLGHDGGGWMECRRVPCVESATAECTRIAIAYRAQHAPALRPLDARTEKYERTNGDVVNS